MSRLGLPSEYDYWLAEYSPIIPQKSITTSVYVSLVAAWWRNEVIWYWHLASPMWRKCSPNTIQYIVDMNLIWKMIWQIICMICKIICNDNDNEKLICSYIEYWNKFLLKVYYFGPTPPPFLRKKSWFWRFAESYLSCARLALQKPTICIWRKPHSSPFSVCHWRMLYPDNADTLSALRPQSQYYTLYTISSYLQLQYMCLHCFVIYCQVLHVALKRKWIVTQCFVMKCNVH